MKESRRRILESQGGRCFICGKRATQVHHCLPKFMGGSSEDENLVGLDFPCHKVADRLARVFKVYLSKDFCQGCDDFGEENCPTCLVQEHLQ